MTGISKLSLQQANNLLRKIPLWRISNDGSKIHRSLKFQDFNHAFAFMTRVALYAEKYEHHPTWKNVYDSVDIELSTHDAGGLSVRDFQLAEFIDSVSS